MSENENLTPLIIIDGHALAYRSYYGMKQGFEPTIGGQPAGMVYGFCRGVMSLMERYKSLDVLVTFDTPKPTHRHEKIEEYKGQREKAPDDFYPQFEMVDQWLAAANITVLRCEGFEADDVIATICETEAKNRKCVILTGDHDLWSLVKENVAIVPLHGNLSTNKEIDDAGVLAKFGITPAQIPFYKALCGDSSDNYKGVPGIGPKGAVRLIEQFESYAKLRKHVCDNEFSEKDRLMCKIQNDLESADLCFEIANLR
jgi:DNA polymerase-1